MPGLRATKVKGKFSLELRHALHVHRHFAAKGKVQSYASTVETAISGALIFMDNVSRDDLPQLPARTTSMLHDERFHYVQRRRGCAEILAVERQFLSLIYDDATKRGICFNGAALLGSRLDTSLYYEVTRVTRLQKDNETGATKSGLNEARALIKGLEDFAGGSLRDVLWNLFLIMVDTTGSNTGTLILSGKGGSASHLRARIEELTRGPNGTAAIHVRRRERRQSGRLAHGARPRRRPGGPSGSHLTVSFFFSA